MLSSSRAAVAAAWLVVAGLAATSGCRPADEETGAASLAAATAPGEPPPGVLRVYVWECDGGLTLSVTNLDREGAVTLDLHEGPRKLSQVVSASGAKYADETITIWTRGNEATFERKGAPPVNCREVRSRSLLADARERGVLYRGRGNEPGWTVEIGPDQRLSFVTAYGQERHDYKSFTTSGTRAGEERYSAGTGADRLEVRVARDACADDMSGAAFDYRMLVEYGGRQLRGCAARP